MKLGRGSSKEVISVIDHVQYICRKKVMRNSIQFLKCKEWVYKRCSGIHRKLKSGMNYECGRCNSDVTVEKDAKLGCDEVQIH